MNEGNGLNNEAVKNHQYWAIIKQAPSAASMKKQRKNSQIKKKKLTKQKKNSHKQKKNSRAKKKLTTKKKTHIQISM